MYSSGGMRKVEYDMWCGRFNRLSKQQTRCSRVQPIMKLHLRYFPGMFLREGCIYAYAIIVRRALIGERYSSHGISTFSP